MKLRTNNRNNGYSIIELTIVLMVMSILTASVLASSTLIKEAKIRSIIAQLTHFENAISDFQKVYKQLPGDFSHTYIWANEDIANTCYKIQDFSGSIANELVGPNQAFIKGNGDGIVWGKNTNPDNTGLSVQIGTIGETEFVTCHLVLSGILSKTPNVGLGIALSSIGYYTEPKETKYKAGYFVDSVNRLSLFANDPNWPPGNSIYLTSSMKDSEHTAINTNPYNATLTFSTLRAIDIKMDDGKPGTGQIMFGSYNDDKKLCSGMGGKHYCTPDSTYSTTTAKNEKGVAWLIYRPRWLSDE